MANEVIYAYGTTVTLEANGASFANNAIVQADDAGYSVVSDGASFPDAIFVLKIQFATVTSIENKPIILIARPKNIDGSNHAPAPTATFLEQYVAAFTLQASSSSTDQYAYAVGYDLPKEADYYLLNNAGQTAATGWTLKVTPRTYKPT